MKKQLVSLLLSFALVLTNTSIINAADKLPSAIEESSEELEIYAESDDSSVEALDDQSSESISIPDMEELTIDEGAFDASFADISDLSEETDLTEDEEQNQLPPSGTVTGPEFDSLIPDSNPDLSEEIEYDVSGNSFSSLTHNNLYVSLPTYTTPKLPPLRNQGYYGTCWAHSLLSMAEISLLKTYNDLSNVDLSELHLAYFTYHTVPDPLGGTSGDTNDFTGVSSFLNRGGNPNCVSNILATWTGAVDETDAPYSDAATVDANGLPSDLAYQYSAHMENFYTVRITDHPYDIYAVKKLVYDCGAVGIIFQADTQYYNSTYNSYNAQVPGTNHAVTIVGWDDNFDKNHFNTPAPYNGAWIIRNSWTSGSYEDNQSFYGYFYMSYYDKSLYNLGIAYDFRKGYDYNNYQYDGGMFNEITRYTQAANVFTANGKESLEAISFSTIDADCHYVVDVYTFDKDAVITDPTAGTKVASIRDTTVYGGYLRVPMETAIPLNAGDKFSVVVTLSREDGISRFMAETNLTGALVSNVSARSGQSYVVENSQWIDYGAKYNKNVRIKAFTRDVGDSGLISLQLQGPTEIEEGATATYTAVPTPSDCNLKDLTWASSNPSVLSIDSKTGSAIALSEGTVTITATCDGVTATIDVVCSAKPTESYIIYDPNGGSGSMKKSLFTNDTPITITPNSYSRVGYKFREWNTEPDGTGIAFPDRCTIKYTLPDDETNLTLYAQWTGNKYIVYYNGNGGVGSMTATNAHYGTAFQLPTNAFRNGKKVFSGWNTDKNGKGTQIAAGALVKNLTSVYNGTVTLYAQWTDYAINKVSSIKIYTPKSVGYVAKGKTLRMIAEIDGVNSKKSRYGKYLIWSIDEELGTGGATINPKTGVLTATREGTVYVKATNAANSEVYGLSEEIYVYIPFKKASLNKSSVTLAPGTTYQLSASLVAATKDSEDYPTLDKNITWSLRNTSDSQYVTVDSTGLVTAVTPTIKPVVVQAKFKPYNQKEKTYVCKVTVKDVAIKSLSFSPSSLTIQEGGRKTLYALTSPETISVTGVTWEVVSGSQYISLIPTSDYSCLIVAGAAPKNKVTAKVKATSVATNARKKNVSKTLTITVTAKAASISLRRPTPDIKAGKSFTLSPIVYTSQHGVKAVNQKVWYSSSNESVLTVSPQGKITGKMPGDASVTITSQDNPDTTLTIPVRIY